jgi:2-succinyl-6-hydroxy-2,4-cyclohexadiene-1-carboxylate synthase
MPALLHHTETGPPDAPPLVLLHGFLGRAQDWRGVAEGLGGRFRCVALDLPGHGRSAGLPAEAYTWGGTLDAVAATLDALGLDRFRLVGYSMGGRLALGFALRHPRRAVRLVVVGASPGLRTEAARAERAALDEQRARALEAGLGAFLQVWYRMPLFAALEARPALREALVANRLRQDPAELARALRGSSAGRMPDLWPHLDALGAPTLAVAGAKDPKFADLAHRMAAAGAPVVPLVLPDAGHLVPLEQPALLADAVADFCADALRFPPAAPIPRAA